MLASHLFQATARRLGSSAKGIYRFPLVSSSSRLSTIASATRSSLFARKPTPIEYAAFFGIGAVLLLTGNGTQDDFYDYRYYTEKDPDDLAGFYGGEELMELFCLHPLVGKIMMRAATFDDVGNITTTGIPGTMEVKMVFSDEPDENGQTKWFNKRERFKNTLMGYTIWDLVINYGFKRLDDGRIECYHQGESFHGTIPLFSFIVKQVFYYHAAVVTLATKNHINNYAFTAETEEEEEIEERSRKDILLHIIKDKSWSDIKAIIFGEREDEPRLLESGNEENDNEEDEIVAVPFTRRTTTIRQDSVLMKRITEDIAFDRSISQKEIKVDESKSGYHQATAAAIQRHKTRISLRRATSLQKKAGDMENLRAEKIAVKNSMSGEAEEEDQKEELAAEEETSLNQTLKLHAEEFATVMSARSSDAEEDESQEATEENEDAQPDLGDRIQKYIAEGSENLGGNDAWEMASTNKEQLEGADEDEEEGEASEESGDEEEEEEKEETIKIQPLYELVKGDDLTEKDSWDNFSLKSLKMNDDDDDDDEDEDEDED